MAIAKFINGSLLLLIDYCSLCIIIYYLNGKWTVKFLILLLDIVLFMFQMGIARWVDKSMNEKSMHDENSFPQIHSQ